MGTKIKVKNLTTMLYNAEQGYFSDGNFMIRANLIELDNPCLQIAINQKISFNFGNAIDIKADTVIPVEMIKENYGEAPKMTQLIPQHTLDTDLITDTNLMYVGEHNRFKHRVLTKKADASHISYANYDYIKMFLECGCEYVQMYQQSVLSAIKIMSKDEVIGLLMPVMLRENAILDLFYAYHKQMEKEGKIKLK